MKIVNPFANDHEARRYHEYRPRYHDFPFTQIRNLIGRPLQCCLDVACGTGHSTYALSRLSQSTIGCDASRTMLRQAKRSYELPFVEAEAEHLPFENSRFDLVNISMGFHWIDQDAFLSEAKRVLLPTGYLSVDNYGFLGRVSQDSRKQESHRAFVEEYLRPAKKLPLYPTSELLERHKLVLIKELKYENTRRYHANEFTQFLMTWSNYQVLSENRKRETAQRMEEVYEEIFGGGSLDLEFAGQANLYRFG